MSSITSSEDAQDEQLQSESKRLKTEEKDSAINHEIYQPALELSKNIAQIEVLQVKDVC